MPQRLAAGHWWFIAAVGLSLAACDGGPSWKELKSPEGGFRVVMRGDANVERRDIDTPLGKVTGHWYSTERKDAVFGVGYADYPSDFLSRIQPRELYGIVREGWLKRIEGKLQGDGTDIRIDGHPGTEFVATGRFDSRDAYLRGRLCVVGNRLYQVVVFGPKETLPLSDINKFMDSFKFTPVLDAPMNVIDLDMGTDDKARKKAAPPK